MINLANKKILIVEDFAEFARSLRGMLHPMGATDTKIVYNAQDAIEACKSTKYDLILSDYNLGPKKDGQQLLEELQHEQLIKSNCIFIMITAENTTSMVMAAVEYVPDSYIAKPFNGNLLRTRLEKAFSKKAAMLEINRAIRNKQWQEALSLCESVKEKYPKYRMSCLRASITALQNLGQLDAALRIAQKITTSRNIPWALESIGEIYFLKKDYEKALRTFQQLIQEFPMSVDGYDWLAKIQQKLGKTKEAQRTIEDAIQRSPRVLQRQKKLGELAELNNDYATMANAYRCAIKYGQHSSFSSESEYLQLSSAISDQIRQDLASSSTEIESKENSDEQTNCENKNNAKKVDIGKLTAEANRTLEQVSEKFPKSPTTNFRLKIAKSSLLKANGQIEAAEKLMETIVQDYQNLGQQLSEDASIEVAKSLLKSGQTEFADEVIETAIKQNFDNTDFIIRAAKVCDKPEILKLCKQASKLNNLGIEYFEQNDYQNAANAFSQVNALAPGNINMALNYIQTLLKLAQASDDKRQFIQTADSVLQSIPEVKFPDPRYQRYKELKRLTTLLVEKQLQSSEPETEPEPEPEPESESESESESEQSRESEQ